MAAAIFERHEPGRMEGRKEVWDGSGTTEMGADASLPRTDSVWKRLVAHRYVDLITILGRIG